MRTFLTTSALLLSLAAPSLVAAEGLTFSGGATLTSRYVSNGLRQSDGLAFQPWVEGEVNGFYFGAWASNVSKDLLGQSSEVDLYFGYRNEVGKFNYDLGYAHYFYRGPKEDCCGEIILAMGYAATEQLGLGLELAYDPDAKVTNASVNAAYAVNDKISLAAELGKINKGGQRYWSVGGSYAINDALGASLTYHDSNIDKGTAVLALDYSFSFR
jgi:uncharacterized protein (TIGR02001 family)